MLSAIKYLEFPSSGGFVSDRHLPIWESTTTHVEAQRLYNHRFSEQARKTKQQVWRVIVQSFLQKWIAPHQTVLDLGCGDGEFLTYIRCARRIGVDLNANASRFLNDDIEFHQSNVWDLTFLPENCLDVVFTSNLMEHLPTKSHVERMVLEVRRVLKPNGCFIALGPNLRFVPGSYWDFWDHHIPITDRSLGELLTTLDFTIINSYAKFLPYSTCSALPKSPWLVWLYLKIPLAWLLLGKQFLIRATKT